MNNKATAHEKIEASKTKPELTFSVELDAAIEEEELMRVELDLLDIVELELALDVVELEVVLEAALLELEVVSVPDVKVEELPEVVLEGDEEEELVVELEEEVTPSLMVKVMLMPVDDKALASC